MCKLFINADPELWVSRTHSLRIDGMVTSVRMENAFWQALADLAERDGMNLPQMITRLYHESIDAGTTSVTSRPSFGCVRSAIWSSS